MFQYIIISIICTHNFDIRHLKRLIGSYIFSISVSIWLIFNLDTTFPVVCCNGRIAFHDISVSIYTSIGFIVQLATSCFRFQNTMSDIRVFRCSRSRLVVVVNHIEHSGIITTIRRTVNPVEHYIIDKVEYSIPTDRRITACVASP